MTKVAEHTVSLEIAERVTNLLLRITGPLNREEIVALFNLLREGSIPVRELESTNEKPVSDALYERIQTEIQDALLEREKKVRLQIQFDWQEKLCNVVPFAIAFVLFLVVRFVWCDFYVSVIAIDALLCFALMARDLGYFVVRKPLRRLPFSWRFRMKLGFMFAIFSIPIVISFVAYVKYHFDPFFIIPSIVRCCWYVYIRSWEERVY